MKYNYIALILFMSLAVSCSKDKNNPEDGNSDHIPSVLADNFNLAIFSTAVKKSGLNSSLNQNGPFTALAPADAAYNKAGFPNSTAILTAPVPEMVQRTTYHILDGKFLIGGSALQMNKALPTLTGTKVFLSRVFKGGDTLTTVNGARILRADIKASNGTIHVIDRLLEPVKFAKLKDAISAQLELTLFYHALLRSGLLNTLNQEALLSVFAPTNTAIRAYGYADIEAIDAAEPADLAKWLRFHISTDFSFAQDYFLRTAAGKNSYETTMLDGGILKINLLVQSNTPNSFTGITALGPKNSGVANIVRQDILTGNGVIQIIDAVLKN